MGDARIVPAFELQFRLLPGFIVYGVLRDKDGSRRLDDGMENDRHAVGDAAVDARVAVGAGDDCILLQDEGIVGLRAKEAFKAKAFAKRNALDGRHREEKAGQLAFNGVKERFANAGGQPFDAGFENRTD